MLTGLQPSDDHGPCKRRGLFMFSVVCGDNVFSRISVVVVVACLIMITG